MRLHKLYLLLLAALLALPAGPDRSYLWILARKPELPPAVLERLVARAAALGFDTSKLIYPGVK